ncbi:hypothetical protein PVAND_009052 [Polypedilum vanderplanki]|uniref:Ionotropic receptor n=1 Tax=Polypedilum vanderplanki TaxID=319348 RepID=A0A9J6CBW6_POLVA|nr:hypothetical protein PVAND_009052 [Polypedilum vanderplanki]
MEIRFSKKRRKKNNKNFGLNVFKIIFACLIVLLALFVEISCQNVKYKALKDTFNEEPTEPISKSIADVIDEFYIKNNIDFDIIIYGNRTNHINDVINSLKETFLTTLKHIPDIEKWDHNLNRSAIFFTNFLSKIKFLHEKSIELKNQFTNLEPRKFKFLVYIENAGSYKSIENKIQSKQTKIGKDQTLSSFSDLMFYEILLFNDRKKIILAANVFYSEKKCGKSHLKELNSFDKKTKKWEKMLENFDHYANFHGCILNFITEMNEDFYAKGFKFKFFKPTFNLYDDNIQFTGTIHTIIETLTVKHNFTVQYEIEYQSYTSMNLSSSFLYSFILNKFMIIPKNFFYYYDSLSFDTFDFYFLISQNDLYTNYEKLTFPFDITSWILIFVTFGLTFTSIFGLQFCPRWLRTIVFGRGIIHPAYNALGIFFGISQIRLPRESFCRAILIIYLCFCLIIRTCWQSKMFECITNDMRKPLPESIEDLINMNYKVISTTSNVYEDILNGREGPEIIVFWNKTLHELYNAALDGETKSKYAFLVNPEIHQIFNSLYNKSLPTMKNERITYPYTFLMYKRNIMTHPIIDIINELIPSGILQHETDYGMWYMHRPVDVEVKDPRRILSMSDLEFGFVIFLGAISLSIVVFICELHVLYLKRQLRKFLGLFVFIRVIRERLKDYHDRW